jgi:serine/threonine protein kinase
MSPSGAVSKLIGGRYKKRKKLGAGGMQEVFEAEDISIPRRVALKTPITASAKQRFDRSAKVSAKVIHPNIAATLDYVHDGADECLIEELIPGLDLQQRFESDFYALDPHLAAHAVHHIAKGVAAAHHAKVIHRDLKPSNIMVSPDPNLSAIKVTDFGIAKMAEQIISSEIADFHRDSSTITGSKTLLGAIPYMAPEALKQPSKASYPADIWAIGALGYWLVAGHPPFGTGLPAIAKILGADALEKPRYFGQSGPLKLLEDNLWKIMELCLNRDIAGRPSADELVSMLGDLCYSTSVRHEGVVAQIGIPLNRNACFAEADNRRFFFHRSAFRGFDNVLAEGQRVNFSAFSGTPFDRADLVVLLRELEE